MIDDEFPPHGAHLTVVVVAQHTETSKVPHAPKIAEEYKLSPQSLMLCLRIQYAILVPSMARFSIETRIILRAIPLLTEIAARTALGLLGEKSGPE
jgi:hypothetical protein